MDYIMTTMHGKNGIADEKPHLLLRTYTVMAKVKI